MANPKVRKVYLQHTGYDHHGEGCGCGICNSIGKASEYTIYDAAHVSATPEPFLHVYGCADDVAEQNALALCKEKGWLVIDDPVIN